MQPVPSIPENAPFDARQRLWLNGFLAGLLAGEGSSAGADATRAPSSVPLLILFGSQTGTAEGLARRMAKEAKSRGLDARVMDAAVHGTIDWQAERNLLVITSTYGDGDMPDNAQGFWDWLQTDAAGNLAHLNFSVLALGDTSYEQFCAAGKKIDFRLEQLGAKRIHPRADCDLDYEAATKAWMEGALEKLGQPSGPVLEVSASPASNGTHSLNQRADVPASHYGKSNPFPARLLVNRQLNGASSEKETRHYEIALEDSGLTYEAGDALGVAPVNCPGLVADILGALGCDGEEAVPVPGGELPIRKALGAVFDITKPGVELMQRLAAQNAALRELLDPGRKEDLRKWLWGRGVIDLLLETPGTRFQPEEFVALLKKLAPRLYSIASSPKAHAGQVHLTINTVRYAAHGRARKGVASTFLADRVGDLDCVKIFVQPSHGFKPPGNGDLPMIMVGPGTGVAPFRAFLHERRAAGARGRNWLFFGEQRAASDFYYRDELESMLAEGHLTKLSTAFSRDQTGKIYVQHRMLENAAELWSWLRDGAHFYVCGDASRMARDVDAALHTVVETAGGLGREAAAEFVKRLKAEKRYQRDVY
ncbi:MAG TPA: sulfite reductase subunit alpha [Verrucomicrobiae bacterium]|nr:sulfite reductase subunit alpha [Verrucomicrobiae bacterium]